MMKKSFKALSFVAGTLLLAGCAVKEYRESCPCRLVLDFSEVDTAVVRSADLYVTVPDGYVFTDHVRCESFDRDYSVEVPRTQLLVNAVSNAGDMYSQSGLHIPLGQDCPPLYMHSSLIDADCEQWCEVVRMHKNHCRMTVAVLSDEGYSPGLKLVSNVNGYDPAGKPVNGGFEVSHRPDESGICTFVLPRQADNGMILEITDADDVLKRFSIGEHLAAAGYDWNEEDLRDIDVELSLAVARMVLKIRWWDEEHMFDIVI